MRVLPLSLLVIATACGRYGFDESGFEPDAGFEEPDAAPGAIAPTATVDPIVVSGSDVCGTGLGNSTRNVAIDAGNYIYVVFECGGQLAAAVSSDGGASYSTPQDLGVSDIESIAIVGGVEGEAFIAAASIDSVELVKTIDAGETWTVSNVGPATTASPVWGVSIALAGVSVYIARKVDPDPMMQGVRVFANHARGDGAFTSVDVVIATVFGDIIADPATGNVFIVSDTPALGIMRSIDGGQTFEAETKPPSAHFYSDWALGGNVIFAAGIEETFSRIPVEDTTMVTETGAVLNSAIPQSRALTATPDGTLFTIQEDVSTRDLSLTRFAPGSDEGTSRLIARGVPSRSTSPSVMLPARSTASVAAASGAVVLYQYVNASAQVAVGVEAF